MAKKLNDYIHMYGIGLQVRFDNKFWKIHQLKRDLVRLNRMTDYSKWVETYYSDVVPCLRKLPSMSEEDWKKCFELSMGMVDQDISDKIKKTSTSEILVTLGKAQFVFGFHGCPENDVRIGGGVCFYLIRFLIKEELSVSEKGIGVGESQFNNKEIQQVHNVNWIFHYLLSKGFDLFGFIDEGLALDAETIKS